MRKVRHCPRSHSFTGNEVETVSSKGLKPKNEAESSVETSLPRSPCAKKGLVMVLLFPSSLRFVLNICQSWCSPYKPELTLESTKRVGYLSEYHLRSVRNTFSYSSVTHLHFQKWFPIRPGFEKFSLVFFPGFSLKWHRALKSYA